MIGYPLAPVVAFLRARGTLSILDGAPFLDFPGAPIYALRDYELQPERVDHTLARRPDAMLYLGTSDLCPAAEGWVVRVLAMAYNELATHIDFSSLSAAKLMREDRILAQWVWHDDPPRARFFREVPIIGAPPPTPAARVAAVLAHELAAREYP